MCSLETIVAQFMQEFQDQKEHKEEEVELAECQEFASCYDELRHRDGEFEPEEEECEYDFGVIQNVRNRLKLKKVHGAIYM